MAYRDALKTGTELSGDYRIEDVLGAGGFGITYRAADLRLNSDVAIKEYFPGEFAVREDTQRVTSRAEARDDDYQWGLKSFLNEAQTLARFRHANIVRVSRVFEDNNTAYMVLDLERGRSLGAWLKELGRKPTQQELDDLLPPLLDALETIHDNKFLHRDIAPDNLFVRNDGTPVLLDFGSARQAIGAHSQTLSAVIKSGYSPVEQYSANARQGPWTDIYALGATLYYAISGGAPQEATARLLGDELIPLGDADGSGYRPGFLAAIHDALAPRPEDRPASISAWRSNLLGGGKRKGEHDAATRAGKDRPMSDAKTKIAKDDKDDKAPGADAKDTVEQEAAAAASGKPSFWRRWRVPLALLVVFLAFFAAFFADGKLDDALSVADLTAVALLAIAAWINLRFWFRKADSPAAQINPRSANARLIALGLVVSFAGIVSRHNSDNDITAALLLFAAPALLFVLLSELMERGKAKVTPVVFAILCVIGTPLTIVFFNPDYWRSGLARVSIPALGLTAILALVSLYIGRRRRKKAEAAAADAA